MGLGETKIRKYVKYQEKERKEERIEANKGLPLIGASFL